MLTLPYMFIIAMSYASILNQLNLNIDYGMLLQVLPSVVH